MSFLQFDEIGSRYAPPFNRPLLKWVGNKQRFAHEIISYFPAEFGRYFEPFLGSGAVLGTLAPEKGIGSDCFGPLMEIWRTLREFPETLKAWYGKRCEALMEGDKRTEYERIRACYNANPSGADLVFLCRACYGGVVRFRRADGHMSTPCGVHNPILPATFSRRVDEWHQRTAGVEFLLIDYEQAMEQAEAGDLIYCDPPYAHSQAILYGAQSFSLGRLFEVVERCKSRGVYVVLSIDGSKRSGRFVCDVPIPTGLFEREIFLNCGRSMLKRFQMGGRSLENEGVRDRLLLTF